MNKRYVLSTTETLRWENNHILFLEDHYRSLLSKMRMKRMTIGMQFTPEWLLSKIGEITQTLEANSAAVLEVSVQWTGVGEVEVTVYSQEPVLLDHVVIDLYRDFYITPGLAQYPLTDFTAFDFLGGVYGFENEYDICLLMNSQKELVQTHLGSFFCVIDEEIVTPEASSGLLVNVWRTRAIKSFQAAGLQVLEKSMGLFDLQKAQGVFVLGPKTGFLTVDSFRKTGFDSAACNRAAKVWENDVQQ